MGTEERVEAETLELLETPVEMGTPVETEATWAEENRQVIQTLNHLLPPMTQIVLMILYLVDDQQ